MTLKNFIKFTLEELKDYDLAECPVSYEVKVLPDYTNIVLSTFEGEPASTLRFTIMPKTNE